MKIVAKCSTCDPRAGLPGGYLLSEREAQVHRRIGHVVVSWCEPMICAICLCATAKEDDYCPGCHSIVCAQCDRVRPWSDIPGPHGPDMHTTPHGDECECDRCETDRASEGARDMLSAEADRIDRDYERVREVELGRQDAIDERIDEERGK
jgi:hypothetical protein